jgi:hypothetical protein
MCTQCIDGSSSSSAAGHPRGVVLSQASVGGQLLLDPTSAEQQRQDGGLLVAYLPARNEVGVRQGPSSCSFLHWSTWTMTGPGQGGAGTKGRGSPSLYLSSFAAALNCAWRLQTTTHVVALAAGHSGCVQRSVEQQCQQGGAGVGAGRGAAGQGSHAGGPAGGSSGTSRGNRCSSSSRSRSRSRARMTAGGLESSSFKVRHLSW